MQLLFVTAGLVLPWIFGALLLRLLLARFEPTSAHPALLLGYGLFIGYQALYACMRLSDAVFGQVSTIAVSALLLLGAVTLLLLSIRRGPPLHAKLAAPKRRREGAEGTGSLLLFALFSTLSLLHIAYSASELLHLPVFPWDAWGSWMYRAKLWFFSANFLPIGTPDQWLENPEISHSVIAADYPGFVPALSMWCALLAGAWNETLINLPTLTCGVALALAIYGQCRSFAMPRWLGALAAYMMLSLPILGAHFSLGGYADIWMAGYAGLGLLALLRGTARREPVQIALGLLLVVLAITVKREGVLWSLVGLSIIFAGASPRILWPAGLAVVAAACGLLLSGGLVVDLPVVGRFGVAEGNIHLPRFGAFPMVYFPLWKYYFEHFFAGDSWHLLWTLVLILIVMLPLIRGGRLRRCVVAFLLVTVGAQLILFQLTGLGVWVATGAIINRVQLQMIPSLVFSIALVLNALRERPAGEVRGVDWVLPTLALATASILLIAQVQNSVDTSSTDALRLDAERLQAVVGSTERDGTALRVSRFSDGIAVISSGPLALTADDYDLLYLRSTGTSTRQLTVFWRTAGTPEAFNTVNVERPGRHWIDLDAEEQWRGEIVELGTVAYADEDGTVAVEALDLLPRSARNVWRQLISAWSPPRSWSQRSVNFVHTDSTGSIFPLPLLAAMALLVAVLLAFVRRDRERALRSLLGCAVAIWLVLDARWLVGREAIQERTSAYYPLLSAKHLDHADDGLTAAIAAQVLPLITDTGARTVLLSEAEGMDFSILRAKYFALPAPVYAHLPRHRPPIKDADYLWVLRQYPRPPGYAPRPGTAWLEDLSNRGMRGNVILDTAETLLIELEADP